MSKSLGNFFTLRDVLAKGYSGREIRFALLGVHYRLPLNFTFEGLNAARSSLQRIEEWVDRITKHAANDPSSYSLPEQVRFDESLDDDLNIAGALGHLFDAIRESNRALDKNELTAADARALLDWWNRINATLALEPDAAAVPAEVSQLVEARQQARAAKEWAKSDQLRDQIAALGWQVKDTKDGPKLTRNS